MTSRGNTITLTTLDPADPQLRDLEPLKEAVTDASVVGIGEGAHFVREFTLARARLLRYLVEQCGFTVVALELGALQATALNAWLAGDGDDADLPRLAAPLTTGVFGQLLRWLRVYNRSRPQPLRIIGADLPNTLTLSPDLDQVAAYLREADPPAAAVLEEIRPLAARITGASAVVSAPQWGALGAVEQNALTAGLARLSLRLRLMEPLLAEPGISGAYATARRHLDAAIDTDYQLRAMNGLFAGDGAPCDPSLREHHLATAVRDQLAVAAPDDRIVVLAHNNHLQKTPVVFDGELAALPMGYYLARSLGTRYRTVALTHTGRRVPEMVFPAEDSPVGFTLEEVDLPAPPDGSIEKALVDAGYGTSITMTDVRRAGAAFTSIRSQSAMAETDLRQAFDVVVASPTATRDETVSF